jgi:hypothetical protein
MNRRDMIKAGLAAGILTTAPRLASAQAVTFAPMPKGWRTYVLTTRVEPTAGATKAWIPLPTFEAPDWQRPGTVTWTGNAKLAERVRDPKYGAEMLRVEWAADQPRRARSTTGSWTTPSASPRCAAAAIGDIRSMLETGNLSGKCADLNALYVGLARAAGLPARDVYGIRVADSRFGYKSLGKSGNVSKAQHCRAEVFLERFGWVPVDPADVRKVVLEEPPGKLSMVDPKVIAVRKQLFGAWEMNWLAYNDAHDLKLPTAAARRSPS